MNETIEITVASANGTSTSTINQSLFEVLLGESTNDCQSITEYIVQRLDTSISREGLG